MTDPLTAAQMRAIETAAIESGAVTGLELMERAGRGVVDAVFEKWPQLAEAPHRAVVLCGPGNNGGDGFVVARLLKERGWEVEVYLFGLPDKLPPDARENYNAWAKLGPVKTADDRSELTPDLMVDAVFGTGLTRPVENPMLWEWFWHIDNAIDLADAGMSAPKTVAIDLPSGLDTDTGAILGDSPPHGLRSPHVMLTVTFHRMKHAHRCGEGPANCGKIVVKDIGL